VHTVWAVNVLHFHLSFWWNYFTWGELSAWNYGLFLVLIGYTILLYLLAVIIYPKQLDPGFDFKQHLLQNRVWFFGILTTLGAVDFLETMLKASAGIRPMPDDYIPYAIVLTGAAVACLVSRNTKVLAAGGLIWLGVDLYYNATALGALGDLFNR
jgi:hypothetical protein